MTDGCVQIVAPPPADSPGGGSKSASTSNNGTKARAPAAEVDLLGGILDAADFAAPATRPTSASVPARAAAPASQQNRSSNPWGHEPSDGMDWLRCTRTLAAGDRLCHDAWEQRKLKKKSR